MKPKPLPHVPTLTHINFDANARCDYNVGSPRHTTDKYLALKYKVHDFLDRKIISYSEENLNMKNNPLSGHAGPTVNSIE